MSQPNNFDNQSNGFGAHESLQFANPFNPSSVPPAQGTGPDVSYVPPETTPNYFSPTEDPQPYTPYGASGSQPFPVGSQLEFQSAMMAVQPAYASVQEQKSWVVTLLLVFFLGGWGAHNFYLGKTSRAVAQLVLTILGIVTSILIVGIFLLAIVGLWVLVEFILIIIGANGYNTDAQGVPLAR